jgi:hypothetical protein
MKKRLFRLLLVTGTFLILLTACEYDYIVPSPPEAPPSLTSDTLCYTLDIQPFFDAKCAQCHPSVYKPDLTSGKSYNALISGGYVPDTIPANSMLYTKIATGSMAGYATDAERNLIFNWITFGAKAN